MEIKMNKLKTFKLEQKFNGTADLYKYLLKNVDFIGRATGVQIQKPLKDGPFCLTGREKITERNILFFASKQDFPESLGELIVFAGAFDVDIVVFLMQKLNNAHLEALNWLQKICNEDAQFIVGEIDFYATLFERFKSFVMSFEILLVFCFVALRLAFISAFLFISSSVFPLHFWLSIHIKGATATIPAIITTAEGRFPKLGLLAQAFC